MRRPIPWLRLLCAASSVASTACADDPSRVTAPAPTHAAAVATLERYGFRSVDDEYEYLARTVPGGFGGLYFEPSGQPVVYLQDLGKQGDAARILVPHFRQNVARAGKRADRVTEMRFRAGQFDFATLAQWRRTINDHVFRERGIVSTDVDETRNRIVVRVEDHGAVERFRGEIARLGVPNGAVIVEVGERDHPVLQLDDRVSLVPGGFQIKWLDPSSSTGVDGCTLGFNAYRAGTPVFITASHCSNVKWGPDTNLNYWQGLTTNSSDIIGHEYYDPSPYYDSGCSTTYYCRWADALVGLWTATSRFYPGRIARTISENSGWTTVRSDSANFFVLDKYAYGYTGEVVYRVGYTSGLWGAYITNTCVDLLEGSTFSPCQEEAPFSALAGDSGGPVFSLTDYPGWVILRGVVWGGRSYSNMSGVERDLGPLEVTLCNPSNPWYPEC